MKTTSKRAADKPTSISGGMKRDYTERYKKRKLRRLLVAAGTEQPTQAELNEQEASRIRNQRRLEKKKCAIEEKKIGVTLKQTEGLKEKKIRVEVGKSVCVKEENGGRKNTINNPKVKCNKSGSAEETTDAEHFFGSTEHLQAGVAQPVATVDLTASTERRNEATALHVKESHEKKHDRSFRVKKRVNKPSSLSPGTIKDRTVDISCSPPKQHDQRPLVLLSIVDNQKEFADSTEKINEKEILLPDSMALKTIIDTTLENQEKAETLLKQLKSNTLVSIYNSPVGFRTEITYFPGGKTILDASLSSFDLHQLLAPTHFLTDASIHYYRCLLMREELRRWHRFKSSGWRKCIIHSTLFMTALSEGDFENTFDKAKRIDHELLGEFMSGAPLLYCLCLLSANDSILYSGNPNR